MYNANHMTFWKRQNYGDRKRLVVVGEEGRDRGRAQRNLRVVRTQAQQYTGGYLSIIHLPKPQYGQLQECALKSTVEFG